MVLGTSQKVSWVLEQVWEMIGGSVSLILCFKLDFHLLVLGLFCIYIYECCGLPIYFISRRAQSTSQQQTDANQAVLAVVLALTLTDRS